MKTLLISYAISTGTGSVTAVYMELARACVRLKNQLEAAQGIEYALSAYRYYLYRDVHVLQG